MTVVASSPSNMSGNKVTISKVIRGGSASAIVVFPAHQYFTGGGVDVQHELRNQRDHALAGVGVLARRGGVAPVPHRPAPDAQRPAVVVLDRAADDVLDEVLARPGQGQR